MAIVKVGLDQWIVAGTGTELCTDGLSGCVAVMLFSRTQACLAFVHKVLRAELRGRSSEKRTIVTAGINSPGIL
ncbi:MAG: hypothetical protein GY749_33210 [Desulfobacteraceae bacterium]|nr:hypothetical protein [Desulfobacteraceae bacterium]